MNGRVHGRFRRTWRRAICLVALVMAGRASAQSDPSVVGQWSSVMQWGVTATHTHVLPTGKVMLSPEAIPGDDPRQWDPVTGALTNLPHAGYNIFCSGHTFLADGRMFWTGGHIDNEIGYPYATYFDPFKNTWTRLPDMNAGRWYPTNTTLANGDLLVLSGTMTPQLGNDPLPQVWQVSSGTWRNLTSANLVLPTYPWMFLAPNGKVFYAGPTTTTRYLDTTGTGAWTTVANTIFQGRLRDYGSAVMYDDGKVMIAGGGDPPTAAVEVIDLNAANPAWRNVQPMSSARRQHTLTLLPDGTVLVTGGSSGPGKSNSDYPVHQAEVWNPATEQWTVLASNARFRGYHSTAVLLPDGRVLSGGSVGDTTAELFSPPYLFKGARPTITSAPDTVNYGDTFQVQTPDAGQISKVTWLRLNSVTHAFDMNQRINRLSFTKGTGALTVTAPSNPVLCPPGHYQMFILNAAGVPSVSKIIRIGGSGPVPPSLRLTAPNGGESLAAGSAFTVRWTSSGTVGNVAIDFSSDGGGSWTNVASALPNSGSYTWTVPNVSTSQALLRLSSGTTSDLSDAAFSITGSGGPPPSGLLFSDDFGRTSAAGLGSAWTIVQGLWRADGSQAQSDFNGADLILENVARCADCRVEASVVGFGSQETSLALRAPSPSSTDRYDVVLLGNGRIQIRRFRSGAATVLGEAPSGLSQLDMPATLGLSASGSGPVSLVATVNGATVLSVSDSSGSALTGAGYAGMGAQYAGVIFDAFRLNGTAASPPSGDGGTPGPTDGGTPGGGTSDGGTSGADGGTPGPVQLFRDDFTRTSSGLGANWVVSTGVFFTDGVRAISDRDGGDRAAVSLTSCADCTVAADVTGFGVAEAALFARAPSTTSADRYDLNLTTGNRIQLRRLRGGVTTVLGEVASGIPDITFPARLTLTVKGAGPVMLTASVNGVLKLTVTDSSSSALTGAGYAGMSTDRAGVVFDAFQLSAGAP